MFLMRKYLLQLSNLVTTENSVLFCLFYLLFTLNRKLVSALSQGRCPENSTDTPDNQTSFYVVTGMRILRLLIDSELDSWFLKNVLIRSDLSGRQLRELISSLCFYLLLLKYGVWWWYTRADWNFQLKLELSYNLVNISQHQLWSGLNVL